jgi:alkanesulfonate monooxygenase SsuD/methylene tetrahydromethanopterin reductase-like flavin-dependent oxidoreductase (luciferase family)
MWIACTNRETIKLAARLGVGALGFAFVDPAEARTWVDAYYSILRSDECVPIGHSVNPNIAMVTGFSVHRDRAEAIRRGQEGFEFFGYALNALVAHDTVPGRSTLWDDFQRDRGDRTEEIVRQALGAGGEYSAGIGTPDDMRRHLRAFEAVGVDQVIFMQQCGRNRHEHICESLDLFAQEVLPEFAEKEAERCARKREELAPYVAAALARKRKMEPLRDDEIPVVRASVERAVVPGSPGGDR